MKTPEQQALDHWEYVEGVILQENEDVECMAFLLSDYLKKIGHHFRTAFVHGYKHGVADAEKGPLNL